MKNKTAHYRNEKQNDFGFGTVQNEKLKEKPENNLNLIKQKAELNRRIQVSVKTSLGK